MNPFLKTSHAPTVLKLLVEAVPFPVFASLMWSKALESWTKGCGQVSFQGVRRVCGCVCMYVCMHACMHACMY